LDAKVASNIADSSAAQAKARPDRFAINVGTSTINVIMAPYANMKWHPFLVLHEPCHRHRRCSFDAIKANAINAMCVGHNFLTTTAYGVL
jgi:hypothetical protein